MAVIKDVANLTGVSISTASKYFNNPNGLAEPSQPSRRSRERTEFQTQFYGTGLQTERTNTIALLDRTQTTVPVTLLSWDSDTKFNSAVLDLTKTMYQATSYLIRQGHSKIAYVNDRAGSRISFQKKGGYLKAMADAGFPVPDGYVYSGNYSYRTGYQATKQFMQCPDPPTAIAAPMISSPSAAANTCI